MHAKIELQNDTMTVHLLDKALKDERLFHSQIIAGQANGTLIYKDAAGKLHVVHGIGPKATEAAAEIRKAVELVTQGVETLAALTLRNI